MEATNLCQISQKLLWYTVYNSAFLPDGFTCSVKVSKNACLQTICNVVDSNCFVHCDSSDRTFRLGFPLQPFTECHKNCATDHSSTVTHRCTTYARYTVPLCISTPRAYALAGLSDCFCLFVCPSTIEIPFKVVT